MEVTELVTNITAITTAGGTVLAAVIGVSLLGLGFVFLWKQIRVGGK